MPRYISNLDTNLPPTCPQSQCSQSPEAGVYYLPSFMLNTRAHVLCFLKIGTFFLHVLFRLRRSNTQRVQTQKLDNGY